MFQLKKNEEKKPLKTIDSISTLTKTIDNSKVLEIDHGYGLYHPPPPHRSSRGCSARSQTPDMIILRIDAHVECSGIQNIELIFSMK